MLNPDEKSGTVGRQDYTGRVITAGIFMSVAAVVVVATTVALGRDWDDEWMDGMIRRVEPQFREITLWDYRGGVSTWDLQVAGAVRLSDLKVGDLVRVVVDRNRRVVLRLYKLPPPEGDDRYWDAVRRLEAETGNPAR